MLTTCLRVGARKIGTNVGFIVSLRPRIYACACSARFPLTQTDNGFHDSGLLSKLDISSLLVVERLPGNVVVQKRSFSGQMPEQKDQEQKDPQQLTLFQKYKKMLKEYWYVLIPVHMTTSLIWFGSFYYAATCGVDIVPLLEYLGVSETLIRPLRNSSLGYLAVASAFYKLATPARYMVTVGGTTLAVRVLTKRGLIQPMPSKERMKEMVKKKTDDFIQRKTTQN